MRIPALPSAKLISPLLCVLALVFCPGVSTQFNPLQAAKDAYNKAKAAQPAATPASTAPAPTTGQPSSPAPTTPTNGAQPAGAAAQAAAQRAVSAAPQPDGAVGGAPVPAPLAAPSGPLDASKLPDVLGIHLGAPRADDSAALQKLYPGNTVRPEGPDTVAGMSMLNIDLPGKSGSDNVHLEFTLTPGKQQVYYIERSVFYKQQMSRDNVMASLRQKYAHEISEDKNGGVMYWLFDEQGRQIPADNDVEKRQSRTPYGCDTDEASEKMLFLNQQCSYANGGLPPATFCDSVIVLRVTVAEDNLVDRIFTVLEDRALLRREVAAAGEAQKAQKQKQQQQDLNKANQAKPNL